MNRCEARRGALGLTAAVVYFGILIPFFIVRATSTRSDLSKVAHDNCETRRFVAHLERLLWLAGALYGQL